MGAKLFEVVLDQRTLVGLANIDVQCGQDEFREVVRPAAEGSALPVQKARRAVDFEKHISHIWVAMYGAFWPPRVVVRHLEHRIEEAFTVAQRWRHVFPSGQLRTMFEVAFTEKSIGDNLVACAGCSPPRSRAAVPPARAVGIRWYASSSVKAGGSLIRTLRDHGWDMIL